MSLIDFDGAPMRQETVRFDVLDAAHNVIGEVKPSKTPVPTITNRTARTIKRTLAGLLFPAGEANDLNVFTDRIRPRWVIEGDSSIYHLGVFLFADRSALTRSYGSDLTTQLVDQTFIIDQPIAESISLGIGTPVATAASDLAAAAAVPAVTADPSSVTLQRPAVWPGGTSLYKVLADLCTLAAFLPPHFDNDGTLRLVDAPDPETATATRSYPPGSPIVDPSIVISDDVLTAPNRWIVVDTGATGAPISGSYELPPSAPHSQFNRGFYVTRYITQQGLMSPGAADAAAKAAAVSDESALELASFTTAADPRHDTYDVIAFNGRRWLENSWTLRLASGGTQDHAMRALYGT